MGNTPARNDTANTNTAAAVQAEDADEPPLPRLGAPRVEPLPAAVPIPHSVSSVNLTILPVFLSLAILSASGSPCSSASLLPVDFCKVKASGVILRSTVVDSSIHGHRKAPGFDSSQLSESPPILPTALTKSAGVDVDDVIQRLIALGMKPSSSRRGHLSRDPLPVSLAEIKYIVQRARSVFMDQPTLLKLSPPVKIVGDIHGQFHDLVRIFNSCGYPPSSNYLFLGDYVDRGHKSLETFVLLLCFKIKYPENFFMLRGNHELANLTKIYGFYDECKRRMPKHGAKLWKLFVDVFNTLPVAAIIADKIFCVHGGLSPDLFDMKQIESIKRPTDIPDKGLLADLLWLDPDPSVRNFSARKWPKNDRGVLFRFGKRHVDHFCQRFGMDLIVRGHMVVEDGYEFFNKRKLVTVFLAPNYCGDFNNFGAVMSVDTQLSCSFELIRPR